MTTVTQRKIVGIVPAAGIATRMAPLPFSKELYPIGFHYKENSSSISTKPVGQYLLEHFHRAGVKCAYIVIRKGKWDIPEYFGDGDDLGLAISYLIMNLPHGVPYSVDQAYAFNRDATIVFGFPDILIEPEDAYSRILTKLEAKKADIALGLFPTDQPHLCDPIELDDQGRIRKIFVKPRHSDLRITWVIAAWAPSFTQFLHEHLVELERAAEPAASPRSELHMGHVFMAAIKSGLRVEGVHLPGAQYMDIGVPENLVRVLRMQLASLQPPSSQTS